MFSPRFIITNKILSNLIDLEKSMVVIGLVPLQTDWELKLKQESLIRRVNAVLRYLGNQLSTDDIAKIVKDEPGRDDKPNQVALRAGVVAKERDIQELPGDSLHGLNNLKLQKIAFRAVFW